jgi:hypothetical protein
MREYAFSYLCFGQKKRYDMRKNLALLNMAKMGGRTLPLPQTMSMTLRVVIYDKRKGLFCHFQDYAERIRTYHKVSLLLNSFFYDFYDIKENIKEYI